MPAKSKKKTPAQTSKSDLKSKLHLVFSLTLVLFGLFLFDKFINVEYAKRFNHSSPTANVKTINGEPIKVSKGLLDEKTTKNPPLHVLIPSQNIDVKVVEAPVINGYWETSDLFASHGIGSANPGSNGNMVVFAHAREGLFYNLKNVQMGQDVYIFTRDKWYTYEVTKITTVLPDQVEVILPTKKPILTLYTCSGFADEKRLIVVAKPI